jgi:hypothetical protein
MVSKRLSVTLLNGRSHILRLPDDVDPMRAASSLCGLGSTDDVGWPGEAIWLPYDEGTGWLRRDAIAEVAVVDWAETPTELYG